jgi:hypothetical protein
MLLPDQRIRGRGVEIVEVGLAKRSQLDDLADQVGLRIKRNGHRRKWPARRYR